jgi:hypothetical protein
MRRALVLGDDAAHHPFLQSLPPHVRGGPRVACREPLLAQATPHRLAAFGGALTRWTHAARHGLAKRAKHGWAARRSIDAADMRDFLLAYCACFVAVSAFIA